MVYLGFEFSPQEGMPLEKPTNSKALCLYVLLQAGLKGMGNYDAIVMGRNWKFSTRLSELINDYDLKVHKKAEKGKNQFGHPYTSIIYCLYECDYASNVALYLKLNKK